MTCMGSERIRRPIIGAVPPDPDEANSYHPDYDELAELSRPDSSRRSTRHDLGARDDSRSMLPGFQPNFSSLDSMTRGSNHRTASAFDPHPQAGTSAPGAIFNRVLRPSELARFSGLSQFQSAMRCTGSMNFTWRLNASIAMLSVAVSLLHRRGGSRAGARS
jgi:hypothetical protein